MFDEKGVAVTTLVVLGGIVFAGYVGYKILKRKIAFQDFKGKCSNFVENAKQAYLDGYYGTEKIKKA